MPVLNNPKHERFAQEVAKGVKIEEAYGIAGFTPHRQNAHRLMTNEDVASRIAEILERGAERAEVSVEMVLRELAKIGFADIRKIVSWQSNLTAVGEDADGETQKRSFNEVSLIDSDRLDDDTAAAISEVSQTKDGGLKIKLHDKRAALVDIGKHLGMFVERSEVGKPGEFADLNLEQKRERAIGLARQLGLSRISPTAGSA